MSGSVMALRLIGGPPPQVVTGVMFTGGPSYVVGLVGSSLKMVFFMRTKTKESQFLKRNGPWCSPQLQQRSENETLDDSSFHDCFTAKAGIKALNVSPFESPTVPSME